MKLLPCVLENGNNDRFELFAYFINIHSDSVTDFLRGNMKNFVDLPADTEQVVKRVRADGIDILVDLAGHTMPLEALLGSGAGELVGCAGNHRPGHDGLLSGRSQFALPNDRASVQ
jgi:hypothetical protein